MRIFLDSNIIFSGAKSDGATLFYLKGTVPPGVTMGDVYRGMWPFVAIQVLGLALCIAFPEIVLRLPRIAGLLE